MEYIALLLLALLRFESSTSDVLPCPKLECPKVDCPGGFIITQNSDQCFSCKCKPYCPKVACSERIICPNGRIKDSNNCTTCDCRPTCVKLNCDKECPAGYQNDANDCPTCTCNYFECQTVNCSHNCAFGFENDRWNCPTCKCNCAPLRCPTGCKVSVTKNDFGCSFCDCPLSPCPTCPKLCLDRVKYATNIKECNCICKS